MSLDLTTLYMLKAVIAARGTSHQLARRTGVKRGRARRDLRYLAAHGLVARNVVTNEWLATDLGRNAYRPTSV